MGDAPLPPSRSPLLEKDIVNKHISINSYAQKNLSERLNISAVSSIMSKMTDDQFYESMNQLLRAFPSIPVDQPIENGFSWHGMSDPEGLSEATIEDQTINVFRSFCNEADISKVAASGDFACLRHFMLTQRFVS